MPLRHLHEFHVWCAALKAWRQAEAERTAARNAHRDARLMDDAPRRAALRTLRDANTAYIHARDIVDLRARELAAARRRPRSHAYATESDDDSVRIEGLMWGAASDAPNDAFVACTPLRLGAVFDALPPR